jgi:hypothetical protein
MKKNEKIKQCIIIPYKKPIENIFITFGLNKINPNEEIQLIEISMKYFKKNCKTSIF